MPDWSYRTIFRPLLFRLPVPTARGLALGAMGALARTPGGAWVIDFLGHMRPDPRLERSLCGLKCPGPVGLAGDLDVNATALNALARLGVGFVEVGPVTERPVAGRVERRLDQAAVWCDQPPNPGSAAMRQRLERWGRLPVPLLIRVDDAATARELAPLADALVATRPDFDLACAAGKPLLLAVAADSGDVEFPPRFSGVVVDAAVRHGDGWLHGAPAFNAVLQTVRQLRDRHGAPITIVAGGVHEPEQALQLREAGADLVQISTGLVYSGPGLAKRINDAWLHAEHGQARPDPSERAPEMTWFWTMLMGIGMLLGGFLALVIAATRVVLPYDEVFSGMSREQLDRINPRLLAFMAHDRVSLAGTMISIGILYPMLSWFGIRRGLWWAKVAVLASAFSGFASFFLFLGFGYFDPFHAFVTAVLFQFLLMALAGRIARPHAEPANLREDWRWRWCQWAQLLFIFHSVAMIGGGCVISAIGTTHVFVPEDLHFMQTTVEVLQAKNPRLVPLVAHDRASFGGMLIASGIAFLLPTLWGFRQGQRWLWWTFFLAAIPGYGAGIGVHFAVGYTDMWHLTPALGGATVFALALALARPYLMARPGSAACYK
jgi:hypothetical protein